jgi:hypothetical protein
MRRVLIGISISAMALQAPVSAAGMAVHPVQVGAETMRYRQGVPTLDLELPTGAIQITPLPFDHGHVTFGIGVYNMAGAPANFGVENVTATIAGEAVPILDIDELARRARSRAMWTQIGIAVLAGAAAGIASTASTTSHVHGIVRRPHGGAYAWRTAYRDNSVGVIGAAAASTAGIASVVGVQNRLDYTLANLSNDIIQTTTVAPDGSYGGRIVLEKPKLARKAPYDVQIVVTWNGNRYPFAFQVTDGVSSPPLVSTTPTPSQTPAAAENSSTIASAPHPITVSVAAAGPASPTPSGIIAEQSRMAPQGELSAYQVGRAQAASARPAPGPYDE